MYTKSFFPCFDIGGPNLETAYIEQPAMIYFYFFSSFLNPILVGRWGVNGSAFTFTYGAPNTFSSVQCTVYCMIYFIFQRTLCIMGIESKNISWQP